MRLGWDEVRRRAALFASEWADAHYERGETQSFWNAFFDCFGVDRRQVAVYEKRVELIAKKKRGFIDLFWPGVLIIEQKSAGLPLGPADQQALDYFEGIPSERDRPDYILTCDFQTWRLHDLARADVTEFRLADLPDNITRFGFILGVTPRAPTREEKASVAASELMGKLHDALKASGYQGHDLGRLLVRLLFCLFADDTGIWPKDALTDLIERKTRADGQDLGHVLAQLFDTLDCPRDKRQTTLPAHLAAFPYINGRLFSERLPMPAFDNAMRDTLLDACRFNWREVSPAIFGALFQSVMTKAERRRKGAHYTTEANIRKVIEPLFLDELLSQFEAARDLGGAARTRALGALHDRLAKLKLLDPACGCGNFLVVAYRELRDLEMRILQELRRDVEAAGGRFAATSRLNVDQFFGIELEEFPALIAETALWMTDHIANERLAADRIAIEPRIPLTTAPTIVHGDALELDWATVLPPDACAYVMGNPPFVGAKYQSEAQRAQVRRIAGLKGSGGTLDYVAAWFLKAGAYVCDTAGIGFVATNSITQGEQVAQLWPLLFGRCGLEIAFAHRTFAWGSDARGKAHVHVVVIGLAKRGHEPAAKRLWSYPDLNEGGEETRHAALTAYLFDAGAAKERHRVVKEEARPINGARRLKTGVQMIDNGILTFTNDQRLAFIAAEPGAQTLFREFLGGDEYINGFSRWILYLADADPSLLRKLPKVRERCEQLRCYRTSSNRPSTVAMAAYPTRLGVDERLTADYLVIPNTSSERRQYIPIGWLSPNVIANQKLRILADATPWEFGILTSAMHMAWTRAITGRLESRYMYSVGVVYNTFPWPDATPAQQARVAALADAVLAERARWPASTLADLYDPDTMPAGLRAAHLKLDGAVDRLYRPQPFASERERVEHLFERYERLVDPVSAAPRLNRRVARRVGGASASGSSSRP